MAVLWSDLNAPQGRLEIGVLFPGDTDDGEERLTGYLADAAARATAKAVAAEDVDSYVTAWSYYRAYSAKLESMAADATSATLVDQGAASWTKDQRDIFRDLAAYWLGVAEGFIPDAVVDSAPGVPASSTTNLVYSW